MANPPSYDSIALSTAPLLSRRSSTNWKKTLILITAMVCLTLLALKDRRSPAEREQQQWELEKQRELDKQARDQLEHQGRKDQERRRAEEHEWWKRQEQRAIEQSRKREELEERRMKEVIAKRRRMEEEERSRKELEKQQREREAEERQREFERRDEERKKEAELKRKKMLDDIARRKEWEKEMERRRQREREATREAEKNRYRSAGISWSVPKAHECISYGTRKYTATIQDVPIFYSNYKACIYMPVVIHNQTIESPDNCNIQAPAGTEGIWRVNFDEVACKPYWAPFDTSKGCFGVGSGIRRIESYLLNLRQGDNWDGICATTPAVFNNINYPGPTYCEYRGKSGMFGVWDIADPACL